MRSQRTRAARTNSHDANHVGTEDSSTAVEVDGFRPVPGHEGYEVSWHGRVRSTDRVIEDRRGRSVRLKGVELTVTEGAVSLSSGGRRRTFTVSRIVRAAWGEDW